MRRASSRTPKVVAEAGPILGLAGSVASRSADSAARCSWSRTAIRRIRSPTDWRSLRSRPDHAPIHRLPTAPNAARRQREELRYFRTCPKRPRLGLRHSIPTQFPRYYLAVGRVAELVGNPAPDHGFVTQHLRPGAVTCCRQARPALSDCSAVRRITPRDWANPFGGSGPGNVGGLGALSFGRRNEYRAGSL